MIHYRVQKAYFYVKGVEINRMFMSIKECKKM